MTIPTIVTKPENTCHILKLILFIILSLKSANKNIKEVIGIATLAGNKI